MKALIDWLGPVASCYCRYVPLDQSHASVVWDAIFAEYRRWSAEISNRVAPYFSKDPTLWRPPPSYCDDSLAPHPDWWACVVHSRLSNMELVCSRRIEHSIIPKEFQGVPFEEDIENPASDAKESSDGQSSGGASPRQKHHDGLFSDDSASERDDKQYSAVPSTSCGRLPDGIGAIAFLSQPANISKNRGRPSAEANYAREYARRAPGYRPNPDEPSDATVLASPSQSIVARRLPPTCHISSGEAAEMRKEQLKFFAKLDAFKVKDEECLGVGSQRKRLEEETPWNALFRRTVAALNSADTEALPSHFVVLDAAVFLLDAGLLNIKNTSEMNIKQGRAMMQWAWWLQNYKSDQWIREGRLSEAPWKLDSSPLHHVLIGGAGAGKTTTLRVIDALLDKFLGVGSLLKSAPTNTAARLLGGDTVHAMYKLPRSTLLGKRAKLRRPVLLELRKRWKSFMRRR